MSTGQGWFESDKDYQARVDREANERTIKDSTGFAPSQGVFESNDSYRDRIAREANERTIKDSTGFAPSQGVFESSDSYSARIALEANKRTIEDSAGSTPSQGWLESDDAYDGRIRQLANEQIVRDGTGSSPQQGWLESVHDYRRRIAHEADQTRVATGTPASIPNESSTLASVSGGSGGRSIDRSGTNSGCLVAVFAFVLVAVLGGFLVNGASGSVSSLVERLISYMETIPPSILPSFMEGTLLPTDNSHGKADSWVEQNLSDQGNLTPTAFLKPEVASITKEAVKSEPSWTQPVSGLSEVESVRRLNSLCPRPEACITFPSQNALLSGVVAFQGTANKPDFQYYKFEYKPEANREWNFLTRFEKPVSNGIVLEWDTRTVPSGAYHLRLIVVDRTGNYWPEFAELRVVVRN